MTEKTDPLLTGLRERFARAAHGADRARTTTFINPNLQALGQSEWMEGYSLNNGQDWALKRMVLSTENSEPVVQQIQQDRYKNISFGEMLYRLQEYENGQEALGFLRDSNDSGQAVGTPLFRDVAAAEGIPHDANGSLVIPQNGHIVGDGKFPLAAFSVAASAVQRQKSEAASTVLTLPQTTAMCVAGEQDIFTMTADVKSMLFQKISGISDAVSILESDACDRRSFFSNLEVWPMYYSRFEWAYRSKVPTAHYTEYVANPAHDLRTLMPLKMGGYVFALLSAADFLCDRIFYADLIDVQKLQGKFGKKHIAVVEGHVERVAGKMHISPFGMVAKEFLKFVESETWDRAMECKKLRSIASTLENIARSTAIDLNAIPEDVRFVLDDMAQLAALITDQNKPNVMAIPPYVGAGPA